MKSKLLGPFDDDDGLEPTGVPPHTLALISVKELKKGQAKVQEKLQFLMENIGLDDVRTNQEAFSMESLNELFTSHFSKMKSYFRNLVEERRTAAEDTFHDNNFEVDCEEESEREVNEPTQGWRPTKIDSVSLLTMYKAWHCDHKKSVKWKELCSKDMVGKTQQNYLRQVRLLAGFMDLVLEGEAKEKGLFHEMFQLQVLFKLTVLMS